MILLLLACARGTGAPTDAFDAVMEAPERGGPPVQASASPLPPFLGVDRGEATYVGPDACAGCHFPAARAWTGSNHPRSYHALEKRQKAFDPACLSCHVTGLGHPGGFTDPEGTPALGRVTCEACHGPGSVHVAIPEPGYGVLPGDARACVVCHTPDNSPEFDRETYWARIAH